MPRLPKALAWLVASLVAAPLLAFGAYDAFVFQPRVPEIRSLVAKATTDEKFPPNQLQQVIRVAFHEQGLSSYVARLLIRELKAIPAQGGNLRWHLESSVWWALTQIHLSEDERTTLYLELSNMGNAGQGFSAASVAIVGTPLSAVALEQAATLVTVAKGPTYYLGSPERLARQSALLVQRAKSAL